MSIQVVAYCMIAVALVAASVAVHYWRRAASLYDLLGESAGRVNEARQRIDQLEQAALKHEERVRVAKEPIAGLEKAAKEWRAKEAALTQEVEAKANAVRYVTDKLEAQKGHLERQLAKAEDALSGHEARHAEIEANAQERVARANAEVERMRQSLSAKTRELETQAGNVAAAEARQRNAERERTRVEATPKAPDMTLDVKRLKRKLAQYDRLYASMKGLREMAEERNRNWEVALERLSKHVLTTAGTPEDRVPRTIGPLVAAAMRRAGAQLIDDEFAPLPSAPTEDPTHDEPVGLAGAETPAASAGEHA